MHHWAKLQSDIIPFWFWKLLSDMCPQIHTHCGLCDFVNKCTDSLDLWDAYSSVLTPAVYSLQWCDGFVHLNPLNLKLCLWGVGPVIQKLQCDCISIILIKLACWEIQCLKVDCGLSCVALSMLYMHCHSGLSMNQITPRRGMLFWLEVCCFSCMNEQYGMLLGDFLYSPEHCVASSISN